MEGGVLGWDRLVRSDLAIRATGVLLVTVGVLAGRHLYAAVASAQGHPMSAAQLLWGALAYLGCTSGGILACLGAHIHDKVRVSSPWNGQSFSKRRAFIEPSKDVFASTLARPWDRQ